MASTLWKKEETEWRLERRDDGSLAEEGPPLERERGREKLVLAEDGRLERGFDFERRRMRVGVVPGGVFGTSLIVETACASGTDGREWLSEGGRGAGRSDLLLFPRSASLFVTSVDPCGGNFLSIKRGGGAGSKSEDDELAVVGG